MDVRRRYSGWFLWAWTISGFVMALSGVVSGSVVSKSVGAAMASGTTSAYLSSYLKKEHRIKRTLVLTLPLLTLVIVPSSYVVPGSFLLGVTGAFMVAMILFAFVASYHLSKVRGKPEGYGQKQNKVMKIVSRAFFLCGEGYC